MAKVTHGTLFTGTFSALPLAFVLQESETFAMAAGFTLGVAGRAPGRAGEGGSSAPAAPCLLSAQRGAGPGSALSQDPGQGPPRRTAPASGDRVAGLSLSASPFRSPPASPAILLRHRGLLASGHQALPCPNVFSRISLGKAQSMPGFVHFLRIY